MFFGYISNTTHMIDMILNDNYKNNMKIEIYLPLYNASTQ